MIPLNSYSQGSPNSQRLSNRSESDSDKTVCEPTEEHTNKAFSNNNDDVSKILKFSPKEIIFFVDVKKYFLAQDQFSG